MYSRESRVDQPAPQEISVARLAVADEQIIDLQTGQPFDGQGYSLYKYGCGEAADGIAVSITDKLLAERDAQLERDGTDFLEHYFITSSAYKHVPTAAYYVTKRMVGELTAAGHPPEGLVRIDRQVTKSGDYSAMSEADRQCYIADNNVHVPLICAGDVAGKTVVVVDDIKNTGSNERSFSEALTAAGVGQAIFCYAAVIDPDLSARYPRIEADLNQAYIKDLHDLAQVAARPDFEVNARICRFVMGSGATSEEVTAFMDAIPYTNARAILAGIVSDGYHTLPEYRESFASFSQALLAKRTKEATKQLVRTLRHRQADKTANIPV